MKEQFEEISLMLDKVVGGQNLFEIDTNTEEKEICSSNCPRECTGGVGTVDGTKKGTIISTPTLEPIK